MLEIKHKQRVVDREEDGKKTIKIGRAESGEKREGITAAKKEAASVWIGRKREVKT